MYRLGLDGERRSVDATLTFEFETPRVDGDLGAGDVQFGAKDYFVRADGQLAKVGAYVQTAID